MDSFDAPVTAWIPVRTAFFRERLEFADAALADFSEALPALLPLVRSGLNDVDVATEKPSESVLRRLAENSILVPARQVDFIRVTARHVLDRNAFRKQNNNLEPDRGISSAIASMALGEAMEILLMFSELSHPGRISTAPGVVVTSQGGIARVPEKHRFPQLCYPEDGYPTWPKITTLALPAVFKWLNGTSFFTQALAVSRIERALAAFTQMVHLGPLKEGETLFRAMQSLESFYCDGTGDLRKQLAEKSAIWVGPWAQPKNVVGHLYDMRSKFIHGSSKLQYWIDHADPWEEDLKHMRSFSYAVTLAVKLVIATLQRCIVDEAHDIEWSYSLKTS